MKNLISRWSSARLCLLSTVFCLFLLPFSQWTTCLSVSLVRLFFSNKPSCRISVFFLAFQNVKIVKLLNVTKTKLLGMKFSRRTTTFVAYHSLFQKKTPWIGLPIFSRKKQSQWLCWYVFSMRCQLITKAKPEKLTQNNRVTFFFALTELIWTTRIFRQAPRLSYILVCGIRIGILGCIRINCYEMEPIIAVYSSPGLPNVSSQKTVGLIRRGIISHN